MRQNADDRRSMIIDTLNRDRMVKIADLSRQFGLSEVSIRRDLERMEQLGLLKRVHGGAVAAAGAAVAPTVSPQKERIGRAAAALVRPNDRVIFDSGTTVLQVTRSLPTELVTNGVLTVITASLPVVQQLGAHKSIHLLLLGGIYMPEYQVVVGPQTVAGLAGLHADKLFLGADGVTLSHGVTTANVLEAEVDLAMIGSANEIILVTESSKIGAVGLTPILPLERVNKLVTDDGAPAEFVAAARERGVEVILV